MTMVCWGCKRHRDIVYTDVLARRWCQPCMKVSTIDDHEQAGRDFLAVTVPHEVGDVVRCHLAGERYYGTGTVRLVSMEPQDGGTPVFPVFHVVFDVDQPDPDRVSAWLCEQDLERVAS